MANRHKVLGIVLAGGKGTRLMPLTSRRAKPAVPFGGTYRLIDLVLSNLVNGGIGQIAVLTQYKSHSLDAHIAQTWRLSALQGQYVAPVPAQQRVGPRWYMGSADAIFQSLNLIDDEAPDYVAVFGADNVYRIDPRQMLDFHIDTGAALTVAGIRVPREGASEFGIIDTSDGKRIDAFVEKPPDPPGLPDDPDASFASMGNYLFSAEALVEAVTKDAEDEESNHDMGGDIVPSFVSTGDAYVYDFTQNEIPGATERDRAYWRDVGSLSAYHEAHMDLVSVEPVFNLYNSKWPILTSHAQVPGAKFVMGGRAESSIVCGGSILAGGYVERSVLSPSVRVEPSADVRNAVILHDTVIGEGAVVHNAILDKGVHVPPGMEIGIDPEADRERGLTVTDDGIVAVGKGMKLTG